MGDSKTAWYNGRAWQPALVASLRESTGANWIYTMNAVGGQALPSALAQLDAQLAADPIPAGGIVKDILLNWGVNDLGIPGIDTAEGRALWISQWVEMFDELHARFPVARIFVTLPWSRNGEDFYYDRLATDIAIAVAERPAFAFVGDDERVWLKGADDGSTMTDDGTHYSIAGHAEAAVQKATVLGY